MDCSSKCGVRDPGVKETCGKLVASTPKSAWQKEKIFRITRGHPVVRLTLQVIRFKKLKEIYSERGIDTLIMIHRRLVCEFLGLAVMQTNFLKFIRVLFQN